MVTPKTSSADTSTRSRSSAMFLARLMYLSKTTTPVDPYQLLEHVSHISTSMAAARTVVNPLITQQAQFPMLMTIVPFVTQADVFNVMKSNASSARLVPISKAAYAFVTLTYTTQTPVPETANHVM